MRVTRHIAEVLERFADSNDGRWPRTGYVIYAGSYVGNSAGIECLHRLCGEFNGLGYPAFVTGGCIETTHFDAPMIDLEEAASLCSGGFCAVYPETISGNPLGATNVVRWVLNQPGLLGGDRVYADTEQVYTYSDVFAPYIENRIVGKLYMPTIDERIFFCRDNDQSKRNLECFYIGKSSWKDGIVNSANTCEITRESPRKSELGKLFRAAKVLYCFDNSTILIYEALFCGCPVVVIPDGTHTRSDFEELELGTTGISWGVGEFSPASVDVVSLQNRYAVLKKQFSEQLARVVAESQANATVAVDWNQLKSKPSHSSWAKRIHRASANFLRRFDRFARDAERFVRNGRRFCVKQVSERLERRAALRNPQNYFFCDGRDFSARQLECFASRRAINTHVFDRTNAFEITLSTPAKEVGKLFRASRRYYTFNRSDPLIQGALLCGCPVTIVGKRNQIRQLVPATQAAAGFRDSLGRRASSRNLHNGTEPTDSTSASDKRALAAVT